MRLLRISGLLPLLFILVITLLLSSFSSASTPYSFDSDGDGIPDSIDKCPGTPPGAIVDIYGCPANTTEGQCNCGPPPDFADCVTVRDDPTTPEDEGYVSSECYQLEAYRKCLEKCGNDDGPLVITSLTASFAISTDQAAANEIVTFTSTSECTGSKIVEFKWYLDGVYLQDTGNVGQWSRVISAVGPHKVKLVIRNDTGRVSEIEKSFQVVESRLLLTAYTDKAFYLVGDILNIIGKLTFDGKPVSGASIDIEILRHDGNIDKKSALTQPDGAFAIPYQVPKVTGQSLQDQWIIDLNASPVEPEYGKTSKKISVQVELLQVWFESLQLFQFQYTDLPVVGRYFVIEAGSEPTLRVEMGSSSEQITRIGAKPEVTVMLDINSKWNFNREKNVIQESKNIFQERKNVSVGAGSTSVDFVFTLEPGIYSIGAFIDPDFKYMEPKYKDFMYEDISPVMVTENFDLTYSEKMLREELLTALNNYAQENELKSASAKYAGWDPSHFLKLGTFMFETGTYEDSDSVFVTHKEDELGKRIDERYDLEARPLTPAEVLEEALKINDNYVYDALLTCHNYFKAKAYALRREKTSNLISGIEQRIKREQNTLAKLADEGASQDKQMEKKNEIIKFELELEKLKEAPKLFSQVKQLRRKEDNEGAWYHLFGTLTTGYAERENTWELISSSGYVQAELIGEHVLWKGIKEKGFNILEWGAVPDEVEYAWDIQGGYLGGEIWGVMKENRKKTKEIIQENVEHFKPDAWHEPGHIIDGFTGQKIYE
ncbi:MAG: hypothetical protein JXA46_19995 [Dehalococcoidales bacterium]|nr:hypothetical protein [Dehalococcoidales bacterium]